MENKLAVKINKICMVTVKAIGMILMAYLFLLSIFSTSVRSVRNFGTAESPQWGRYTYFLPDNPLKHVIWIVLVIVFFGLAKAYGIKREREQSGNSRGGRWKKYAPEVICGVYFLIVLLYILNTRLLPKSDPAGLLRIAEEILNGNFHEFEKEGYMYRYPYQSGFVFLCMAAVKIFGTQAFLALQVVNAVAITMFFYLLGKLAMIWWGYDRKQAAGFILISMASSFPLLLYVTFIYGNLPGMALSTAAIYFQQLFLKEKKEVRIFAAAVCISLAIVLKSNCLIPLVAMLIVLGWEGMKNGGKREALKAVFCVMACCFLINRGVSLGMEAITGYELSEGMPKTALIAMGLEEGAAGPGTESGTSNRIYEEGGFQYKEADGIAREQIEERLNGYIKNPAVLISFFARKMALQCNEPTFQCFSITGDRASNVVVPEWLNDLIAGRGSLYLAEMMNIMHAVILFGVCVYIFSVKVKRPAIDELIFLIIFIGSFLFQMFYEAKSQYMLIFFFMLLPYAVQGYQGLLTSLIKPERKAGESITVDFIKENKMKVGIVSGVVCLIVAAGIWTGLFEHTICLQSGAEQLEEYYEAVQTRENPNG